ncbi:MAG: methyltransferase domain-containing protein [Rickettsiales bacterium]|nr:methyltransferase domain-containing protein [Rickettsiales bacterium]
MQSSKNCPCCESDSTLNCNVISAKNKAENIVFEELKNYWHGFFKGQSFFTYFRCTNCGLLYNKTFFSNEELGELYSAMPDNTAGQNLRNLEKTQLGYFNFLKREKFVEGNYLEFGPDIGLFTKNIISQNNFSNHYLIEPNKNVHPNLEKIANGKKITLLTEMFDLSTIPDNSISLAVMIHVLDHITNPKEMIDQLYKKLSKGGVFLIVTHNEKSLLAKILKSRWPAYCLQHPQLFNTKTTRTFLEQSGFGDIVTKRSINYFSLSYLLKHLLWSLNFKRINVKEIPWLTIPLPLGNIITIAKKP